MNREKAGPLITLILALLGTAVLWGSMQNKVSTLSKDVSELQAFRGDITERTARIETKIDLMMDGMGIKWPKTSRKSR